ncbi:hypothetical protein INK77_002080 [Salmonella enterica subsp. enterica serovar Agbeni]|nr:hypothetical protein [Salmonella enterica subsp. enterica serovar Agbeni]
MKIPVGNFGNAVVQASNINVSFDNGADSYNSIRQLANVGLDISLEAQAKDDQNSEQFALNSLDAFQAELMDGANGLYAQKGQNAEGATASYRKQFEERARQEYEKLPDSRKDNFANQVNARWVQFTRAGLQHEQQQRTIAEDAGFKSRLQNHTTRAQQFFNDGISYEIEMGTAKSDIASYGQTRGWSQDQITAAQDEWVNNTAFETGRNLAVSNPAAFQSEYGEPSSVTGSVRDPASGAQALGIRNNNPGNIRKSDISWVGEVEDNSTGFVTFASAEHGIRALCKNLLSYNRKGYSTISQIISRWAPPEDKNDTASYIGAVSKAMGIPPDEKLDVNDIDVMTRLCTSIIHHENGSMPYSNEQLMKGVTAALGVNELDTVVPAGSKPRLTGTNPEFMKSLTPYQLAQLRNLADSNISQQKSEYRDQMNAFFTDSMAAFNNGEMPENIPSQTQLVEAYGYSDGTSKYAELQEGRKYAGYMAAAKNMTAEGQYALLDKVRPSPDQPGYASNIQRWERFGRYIQENIKQQEKDESVIRYSSSLQNDFPLDPTDKTNQVAADEYFKRNIAPGFDLSNPDSLNNVAATVTRSGIVPSQITTIFNSASRSDDPKIVAPVAKMYGQIYDNNPAAVATLPGETMAFYSKVYSLSNAGMNDDLAVKTAFNQIYAQDKQTKEMFAQKIRAKDYSENRSKAAQSLSDELSSNWISGPSIITPGTQNQQFLRDYQTIYDANFITSGGDAELSRSITNAQLKQVWGVSTINGKEEMMRYSPESVYGVNNGAGNWIKGQWEAEKKELLSKSFGGGSTDMNLILVPDAMTPRDMSYGVMVRQVGSDGIPVITPYYGGSGSTVRFKPEQSSSPMYQEILNKRNRKVQKAEAERLGKYAPEPSPAPLNLSNPYGEKTGGLDQMYKKFSGGENY